MYFTLLPMMIYIIIHLNNYGFSFIYSFYNLIGPHELHHLVIKKRKNGICLPFKVSIKKFSRLAYVSRWDDDDIKVMIKIIESKDDVIQKN